MSTFSTRRALMLGAVLTTFAAAAPYAHAGKPAEVQTIQARPYTMPAGDRTGGNVATVEAPELIIPIGQDELAKIKADTSLTSEGAVSVVGEAATPMVAVPPKTSIRRRVCATNSSTGLSPTGVNGAVGPQNMVVVTNSQIAVYRKGNCALQSAQSLSAFFSSAGVPATARLSEPRVLFDRASNRFFVTVQSHDTTGSDQYQYIAVSTNATGTGYNLYRIMLSEGNQRFCKRGPGTNWNFPVAGVSRGRWYISANDTGPTGGTRSAILSIWKSPTLSGGALTVACFNNFFENLVAPIVIDKARTAIFITVGSGRSKAARRIAVNEVDGGPQNDTVEELDSILLPEWWAAPAAAQPNGQRLDTLDGRFQGPSIQRGLNIWNVHTVKVRDQAKIRMYRLPTAPATVAPSLIFTPTTLENESDNLFNASLATNGGRSMYISATRTVPGNGKYGRPAHVMFAGPSGSADSMLWRFAVIQQSKKQMTGCNRQPGGACRWANYSSTQVEAGKPNLGWGFNQIVGGAAPFNQTKWQTRAGLVQLFRP